MFQLTEAPTGEVVTLAEIKSDLRIDTNDFDSDLRSWIAMAVDRLQRATRRQFLTATWTLLLDRFPCREIRIWKAPVSSIESIKYIDPDGNLQTIDEEDYVVSVRDEPRVIVPALGSYWPSTACQPDAVRVELVAGYGTADDVPDMAKGIIKLMVRDYFLGGDSIRVVGNEGEYRSPMEPLMNHLRWTNLHETEA